MVAEAQTCRLTLHDTSSLACVVPAAQVACASVVSCTTELQARVCVTAGGYSWRCEWRPVLHVALCHAGC